MPALHLCFAIMVAIIWGLNFLFVKVCLTTFPPLLLCALRFILCSFPAIFFVKPPKTSFRILIIYGLIMFALQFALLFMGIAEGMTPGMASLVAQVQVFFSMFFASVFLGEKPSNWQIIGALIAFLGIVWVAIHFVGKIVFLGFVLILGAAASWGVGNLITKKIPASGILSLVVWGSFVASIPMIFLAYGIEGSEAITRSFHSLTWSSVLSLGYVVYISTWVGYGLWNWLLTTYPVSLITPFTLLVPVVGLFSSVIFYHEPLYPWKTVAAVLVLTGLSISVLTNKMPKKTTIPPS